MPHCIFIFMPQTADADLYICTWWTTFITINGETQRPPPIWVPWQNKNAARFWDLPSMSLRVTFFPSIVSTTNTNVLSVTFSCRVKHPSQTIHSEWMSVFCETSVNSECRRLPFHRGNKSLRIAVVCTWCHRSICQSGESRGKPLFPGCKVKAFATLCYTAEILFQQSPTTVITL